jgi:hypothetical protein
VSKTPKSVRGLLDALNTTSYTDWANTIAELRERPFRELRIDITELDLLMLLRPFLWWRHNPGFVDVYATCEAAMPIILAHKDQLDDHGKTAGMFLATYLADGTQDHKGHEIDVHIWAKRFAGKLKGAEKKALRALSALMEDIYGHKHTAYNVLRHVAWQHPKTLGTLIHGMAPGDQGFILHALDADLSKPGVKTFYKQFIAKTPYPDLVKEARRYAMMDDE